MTIYIHYLLLIKLVQNAINITNFKPSFKYNEDKFLLL